MKLLFSIPTGYHLRELVLPLKRHLEADEAIDTVYAITPGAPHRDEVFSDYDEKFEFFANPEDEPGHKELLDRLQPDVVVTNTVGHDPLDYPILQAAQDIGLTTLTFIASWDNVWKIGRMMNEGKPVALADYIIVWNTMMRDHILETFEGLTDERVQIIGAPRLDYFWHNERIPSRTELFEYIDLPEPQKPLLHFSTTELYPMDYVVRAVRGAIDQGKLPDSHLYASVHPGGDIEKHKHLEEYSAHVRYAFGRKPDAPIKDFAFNATEEEMYMLVALFTHADALINHSSTTALESLIGGTPVINVKYGKPWDWWNWRRSMVYRDFKQHYVDLVKDGATYVVESEHELTTSLREALKNPEARAGARDRTIERMITTTDGTAGKRVLAHIKERADS